jgi:hypothetical protein
MDKHVPPMVNYDRHMYLHVANLKLDIVFKQTVLLTLQLHLNKFGNCNVISAKWLAFRMKFHGNNVVSLCIG